MFEAALHEVLRFGFKILVGLILGGTLRSIEKLRLPGAAMACGDVSDCGQSCKTMMVAFPRTNHGHFNCKLAPPVFGLGAGGATSHLGTICGSEMAVHHIVKA